LATTLDDDDDDDAKLVPGHFDGVLTWGAAT
jgi:hypothetical protein